MAQRGYTLDERARRQLQVGRERKGLSQQALADLLGLHRGTIAQYEGGRRTVDGATLNAICEALDLTWEAGRVIIAPK